MILRTEEITWVSDKLNTYDIKYQEVYDELKDHLLTAVENMRAAGDDRHIEILFNEVVKKQFPGYWPFEDIVKQYQTAYRNRIRKTMWANCRHYFNWQTVPLMLLLMVVSFYLPNVKAVKGCMMVLLLLVSIVPVVYVYIKGRHIRTDKGKHSLTKGYMITVSNLMLAVFNLLVNSINLLAPESALSPRYYLPTVCMFLLIISFIYGLSCIRVSNREFKIA
ncbi:hypothetical protein HQ865_17285 [Mucilaginibacter mali]|uniref:Uncharacterized protein n=1 Tax=Mucilaginibacter mali TaxID=2740462 RepID=A0A7D4QB83_9SPHI|nr:hypothetical protein [Mucilaginibacter mali]QKJ31445.1 hypothetical protein HQ865_17285 [Mucilaginibacter mali]